MNEYEFPDLKGRWYLVQAHLHVHNWKEFGQPGVACPPRWESTGMGLPRSPRPMWDPRARPPFRESSIHFQGYSRFCRTMFR